METYYLKDDAFKNTDIYKRFADINSEHGMLKIRAYAASEAIPIKGLKVSVSTIFEDTNIICFEGYTDESGLIERIFLPAPALLIDNLESPNKTEYEITATYLPDNDVLRYSVNMYDGVCVIQNINIIPMMNENKEV
jgi:hypothetical protein